MSRDPKLMLSEADVRVLVEKGQTVGAHAVCHANLALLALDEAHKELSESKLRLEEVTRRRVHHFCFLNPALPPHWNAQLSREVKEAGFRSATSSDPGIVTRVDQLIQLSRVQELRRISMGC